MATRQHADYTYIDVPASNIKGSNASRIESWVEYKVTVNSSNATVDVYFYAELKASQSSTTKNTNGTCTIIVNGTEYRVTNVSYDFGASKGKPILFGHKTFTIPLVAQTVIDATWSTSSTYITSATIPTTTITIIEAIGRMFINGTLKSTTPYIKSGSFRVFRPYIFKQGQWRASV